MKNTIITLIYISLIVGLSSVEAQTRFTTEVEKRADSLLKNMTVKEKLTYIGGTNWMFTKAIPRLGIPQVKMSDGPQGLGTWGASTAYPAAIMLASSWNQELANEYGQALAKDCKARGVHILLGPGVNIARAPMCGRNFEYMGEDPLLASKTSTEYIKGLQANGVMGVIKHFAANFQEYDRNYVSSDIDERTLHEIYFPAFKAAVQQAETGAVMTSYNLLNGVWTTEDPWLLKEVLRRQWGFKGMVMSDWGSTHNCLPAATSGLDLEMASNEIQNEDSLRHYLNTGQLSITDINLKVKHILQTLIAFGFFDRNQTDTSIPLDNAETALTAKQVAREGIVLLKNEENILPLSSEKVKTIAVIGNNADIYAAGGGSGLVKPFRYTSYFQGLKELAQQKGIEVVRVDKYDHMEDVLFYSSTSDNNGLKGEYFNNKELQGNAVATRLDKRISFEWTAGCDAPGVAKNDFSVRWTGELRPTETARYELIVSGDDGFRLFVNNVKVIDEYVAGAKRERRYTMSLIAGQRYAIRLEYFQAGGAASIDFAWLKEGDSNRFKTELDKADVIVAFFGHNTGSEGEASDRWFGLPDEVKSLILEAGKSITPMIGVVNAGGNVEMQQWLPEMKGLLWGWYGGQEAGSAMAEVLLGDYNPSGKLPVTFEKRWEDNPAYTSYYDNGTKHVRFNEGVMIGYRGYDMLNRAVQFPFGYGLSYTGFAITGMQSTVVSGKEYLVEISFTLKNTGDRAGAQVVQLYTGKKDGSPVVRPLRELKNFMKVYLEPGEEKVLTMRLNRDAFSYYSVTAKEFVVDNGHYNIELAFSSRDIQQSEQVTIQVESGNTAVADVKSKDSLVPSVIRKGSTLKINRDDVVEYRVYDSSGKKVVHAENTNIISSATLESGVYYVRYVHNNQICSDSFIVR